HLVEGGAVVGPIRARDHHRAAAESHAEFHEGPAGNHVEDGGSLQRPVADAADAVEDEMRALANGVHQGQAVTGGDGDLHRSLLQPEKEGGGTSPRARSLRCASTWSAAASQECCRAWCRAALPRRSTREGSAASRSIAAASPSTSP